MPFDIIRKGLLREHIPLKQGLRHPLFLQYSYSTPRLREHIPLKQGLRL